MPLVTVRVDEETKTRMESLEGINWSRVLREKIAEVLDRETRRNRMEALRSMDRLRRKHPVIDRGRPRPNIWSPESVGSGK